MLIFAVGCFGLGGEGFALVGEIGGRWLSGLLAGDVAEDALEDFGAGRGRAQFALPDADHAPAEEAELDVGAVVAGDVEIDFLSPKVDVGRWQTEVLAPLVAMPKATIDEDHSLVLGQHYVGMTIEIVFDTKAQTLGEQKLAHHHLGLGVSALHGSHASAALLRCHRVGHTIITEHQLKCCRQDKGC